MRSFIASWVGLVAGAVVIIAALAWAGGLYPFAPSVRQPFAFNHKKHIEADWTCAACHVYVDQEAFASIPKVKDCVQCHESEQVEKPEIPEFGKLRQLAEQGEDIPWVQVYRTPAYVYFSHRRHVDLGELDCVLCHGDMTRATEPVTRQAITINMNRCIDCHIERNVTIDCLACHR